MERPIVVANFDAEVEMARETTPGPHPGLPRQIRERLEAVAPSLAVLADDAVVVTDSHKVPFDATAVLGWAETRSVANARKVRARDRQRAPNPLWAAVAYPWIGEKVNDRFFWLELAREHGWALPETGEIESIDQLRERLPALVAASADGGWSVKAPLSAAGRERVHRWGAELPDDIETRIERLLDRFGRLIAEPWMPRVADFGVAGIIGRDGIEVFPPHRLEIDSGTFQSVVIDDAGAGAPPGFADAAARVADALAAAGHRGAFGIDGFIYRGLDGSDAIAPCIEINARLTFGLVARLHQRASGEPMPYAWRP